ncbi:hypothetical protein DERF_009397 [Dermatophagoides farinae]|uniref:Uncharacterized protein n=1 Tax=Dermatophagoides farinae TaxID=6954 RepID=A0A922HV04_DERFA|nr:hypothetical protein DERF_009397 [Dermatophagoides farinae]
MLNQLQSLEIVNYLQDMTQITLTSWVLIISNYAHDVISNEKCSIRCVPNRIIKPLLQMVIKMNNRHFKIDKWKYEQQATTNTNTMTATIIIRI